jgi:hypothetical protein
MGELIPVFIVLVVILAVIKARWDLRRHIWFWAVIVLILALHVPLFFVLRWPSDYSPTKLRMLPLAVVDAFVVLGAVRFVEKFIVKSSGPEEGSVRPENR